MIVVRSPFAHAAIRSVDVGSALAVPGVVAAFSGEDLPIDWIRPLPVIWRVNEEAKVPDHWPLAMDVARFVGDGVAVVVGETPAAAQDGAEVVDCGTGAAAERDGCGVGPGGRRACSCIRTSGPIDVSVSDCTSGRDIEELFKEADVVVARTFRQQRVLGSPMETRGVVRRAATAAASSCCGPPLRSRTSSGGRLHRASGSPSTPPSCRARRRRRFRRKAERLRGGGAGVWPWPAGCAAGQVDRAADGARPGHHSRLARQQQRMELAATRGRADARRSGSPRWHHWAPTCSSRPQASRSSDDFCSGRVRRRGLRATTARGVHQPDADGRIPRCRAARGRSTRSSG